MFRLDGKVAVVTGGFRGLGRAMAVSLGKAGAHDKTSGTPVTNFLHSTKQYNTAMNKNRGLDRDKDGIACEAK